jgi:hypothetical protein
MQDARTHLPPREAFAAAVSTSFDVMAGNEGPVEFTLLECKSLVSNESQECYTLLFRGPSDQPAVQAIYQLENKDLGKLELFLVPIKRDDDGLYFEAVMNHLLSR